MGVIRVAINSLIQFCEVRPATNVIASAGGLSSHSLYSARSEAGRVPPIYAPVRRGSVGNSNVSVVRVAEGPVVVGVGIDVGAVMAEVVTGVMSGDSSGWPRVRVDDISCERDVPVAASEDKTESGVEDDDCIVALRVSRSRGDGGDAESVAVRGTTVGPADSVVMTDCFVGLVVISVTSVVGVSVSDEQPAIIARIPVPTPAKTVRRENDLLRTSGLSPPIVA